MPELRRESKARWRALRTLLGGALRWGNREPWLLLALIGAAGGLWLFAELADEVIEGETRAFDEAVLLALRDAGDPGSPWGPLWLEEVMRDLTALGGVAVLALMVAAAVGFLWLQRNRRAALFVVAATGGGMLLSGLTKFGFDRPRPDLVPHGSLVYTASFPSGHSLMAAVVYLSLGALLAEAQPDSRVKLYLLTMALTLALLVGVSRVYLGVHWPTDVLAGWAMGASWALLFWLLDRLLRRRH